MRDFLTYPFRGHAFVVLLTFTVLLGVLVWSSTGGTINLILASPGYVILLPLFGKYCLVVGERSAAGDRDPPGLSYDNVSPLELSPLAIVLAPLAYGSAVDAVVGPMAAAVVVGLLFPAMISAVILEDRFWSAFDPRVLLRCAVGLRFAYPVMFLVLGTASLLLVLALGSGLGAFITVFLLLTVLVATFHAVGLLLHRNQARIGFATTRSAGDLKGIDERRTDERRYQEVRQYWYKLASTGRVKEGLEAVLSWLAEAGHDLERYERVFGDLMGWEKRTLGVALARTYIERLLAAGQAGRALAVLQQAHGADSRVRPHSETATLQLAERARAAGDGQLALDLVTDFGERYPDSSATVQAQMLRAELLCLEFGRCAEAGEILAMLRRQEESVAATERFSRLDRAVRSFQASE